MSTIKTTKQFYCRFVSCMLLFVVTRKWTRNRNISLNFSYISPVGKSRTTTYSTTVIKTRTYQTLSSTSNRSNFLRRRSLLVSNNSNSCSGDRSKRCVQVCSSFNNAINNYNNNNINTNSSCLYNRRFHIIKGDRLCQCVTGTGSIIYCNNSSSRGRHYLGDWSTTKNSRIVKVNHNHHQYHQQEENFTARNNGLLQSITNRPNLLRETTSSGAGLSTKPQSKGFSTNKEESSTDLQQSAAVPGYSVQSKNPIKEEMAGLEFKRLPLTVIPQHYTLDFHPNLENFTFTGTAYIKIQIAQATDVIILNALDLQVTKAVIEHAEGRKVPTRILLSPEQEILSLFFDAVLTTGAATLRLEFNGELNDKMKGFYRSKYFTTKGEERYAAVTQFEATDARRCFPCWDEPGTKATFDIGLIVPQDRVALSNMPMKSKKAIEGGLRQIKFERTPIMSTYLVAIVVGEYDYVEGKSSDGVLVRVYTPVGKKDQGLFALDVATKVLPFYKDYFDIAYPLPKMDLIAIADFSAGAMENWGLVTYRETFVLVDPENTSLIRKQSIALTIGHEMAHQWFGNLVTMEWWTDLWLNEGYASFVEFLCVDHLFPEFDIWTQFATDMYIRALELDCLKNSHPIEVTVGHPSEIDEIFDEISYNKGASIIRMLHHYIGDKDFRKGMNLYLTRHQYRNTCTEDLWAALEAASNKPIAEVMSTWIKQMGFPIVVVDYFIKGSKVVLDISQEKFTADGTHCQEEYFWMIPITISTSRNPQEIAKSFMLDKKIMDITMPHMQEKDWIKINPGTVGYYRTKYSPKMLDRLIPAVRDMSLPPLDRLGLVDDLFALVQAGHSSTVQILKFIEAYRNETDYTVWSAITNALTKLQILLSHTNLVDAFNAYGVELYAPIGQRLGWNAQQNESHLDTLLRGLVLNKLVSFQCPKTIVEAKERFKSHVSGSNILPADLRSACYKAVLQDGDDITYESMLNLYRSTDLHEEKDRISRALGSISNVEILKKVVHFAMSEEVRAQDSIFVIVAVAFNPKGRNMTWEFFKANSDRLLKQYQGGFLLARLVKHLTENFASEERAKEIEEFFTVHDFPGTERTVQQSIETIRLNAAWLNRDLQATSAFLLEKKHNK